MSVSSSGSISNGGDISNSSYDDTIINQGAISSLTNTATGTIRGVDVVAIYNYSIITNLSNAGVVSSNSSFTIYNDSYGSVGALNNSGFITNSNSSGHGILSYGFIGSLINSNTISGGYVGVRSYSQDTIATFANQVGGTITGGQVGVELDMGAITNFTNAGAITGGSDGIFISSGAISNLNNSGTISGTGNAGIKNWDSFTLNNTGTVSGGSTGVYSMASGPVSITNNSGGAISGGSIGIYSFAFDRTYIANHLGGVITGAVNGVNNELNIDTISNAGVISGTGAGGIGVFNSAYLGTSPTISTLTNSGSITGTAYGVFNDNDGFGGAGTITTLANSGAITGGTSGVANGNFISTLTNSGSITGTAAYGVHNYNDGWGDYGSITTLTNSGSITGGARGVYNDGVISTLTNYQGGDSSSATKTALTYEGALPVNYYIFVSSTTHYGQVIFSNVSGSMTFGLGAGSILSAGTYASVFAGLDSSLVSNTTGSFNTYKWTLSLADAVTNTWNMVVTPNSIDAATIKPISALGTTVYSSLRGGTLQVDAAGIYSASVSVDASSTNTIDAAGRAATLSGVLSDVTTLGALIFSDSVGGGKTTLTGVNTYTGSTTISSGATLALSGSGSIAASSGVANAGFFDLSATTAGASIKALTGAGTVVLGTQSLTLTAASGTFSGVISGTGSILINGGTQILTGTNTFSGGVTVASGATLQISSSAALGGGPLALVGSPTTPANLSVTGDTTIANAITVSGDPTFNIASGTTTTISSPIADGVSSGDVEVTGGGTLALTAVNTFTGATRVISGSTLSLSGAGSIATASGLANAGTFDLSATNSGASIKALTGAGAVTLGAKPLTITAASGTFSGAIAGSGGLAISGGTQVLSGANAYSGATTIASGATLSLSGAGTVASSSGLANAGTLNISAATSSASIRALTGAGAVTLGAMPLIITAASGTFSGAIAGTGGVTISGGTQTLSGANSYTGATSVASGATLALSGSGSVAATSGLTNNGGLDLRGLTGNATLGGSFTQGSSGNLFMSFSSSGVKSLTVSGAATLAGVLTLTPSGGGYRTGTYHLLTAGSVSGAFSSLSAAFGSAARSYSLSYTGSTVDLLFVAAIDAANTTSALNSSAGQLRSAMNFRATALAGMMDYDCGVFDAHGVCLSFQARYSGSQAMNDGAGVLTGAYRASPNLRLGGFIDQRATQKSPTGLSFADHQPAFGLFAAYSDQADGKGLQARIGGAFNRGAVTVTRSTLSDTEPGAGKAGLNGHVASGELGWGLVLGEALRASPYLGLRYTDMTRNAYGERSLAGTVDSPIAYDDFHQRLAIATVGLRVNGMASERIGYNLGAGVEQLVHRSANAYAGTSAISGLASFAIADSGVVNETTLVGSAGLHYQIDRTQRLTANATLRGQTFSSQPLASLLAGYQAAF